jgi:hypothetical protein
MSTAVFVVAIDGPGGAGKSTTARAVAERLGLSYLDTGALYRCVALRAMDEGLALDDGARIAEIARNLDVRFAAGSRNVLLGDKDVSAAIRTPEVSQAASKVSALPPVREFVPPGPWPRAATWGLSSSRTLSSRYSSMRRSTSVRAGGRPIYEASAGETTSRRSAHSSRSGTRETPDERLRRSGRRPMRWSWTRPISPSRR